MKPKEIKLKHIIGERIKNKRREKGLTQEELAEKASMHNTYVGKMERGEKSPTLDSIEKVVNALDMSYVELFKDIKPSDEYSENHVLNQIINRLNMKSLDDQKAALNLLDFMFQWKEK